MSIRVGVFLSFLFFLFSCGPKVEKLEIAPEVLVQVLADIHFSEGALLSLKPSIKDSIRDLYYDQIYEIHEVTGDAFERDMTKLKYNPKMMERVYEKVMEELENREQVYKEEKPETKK